MAGFVIAVLGAARLRHRLRDRPGSPRAGSWRPAWRSRSGRVSALGVVLRRRQAGPRASVARSAVDETAAPQLLNVVREMAIAANVPMPAVYIINDTAPNAFATGRDPAHASIAVTTGLLEKLDREELQGVIGHELSHVRNFDIRFCADRRGDGRARSPSWPTSSCASPSGAAVGRNRTAARAEAVPRRSSSSSPSSSPSWRRSSAGSSSWPSTASASTWPTRRPSSSPATRMASSAPWPRSPGTARCSRSRTGAPSTCTSPTRSRSSRRARPA